MWDNEMVILYRWTDYGNDLRALRTTNNVNMIINDDTIGQRDILGERNYIIGISFVLTINGWKFNLLNEYLINIHV